MIENYILKAISYLYTVSRFIILSIYFVLSSECPGGKVRDARNIHHDTDENTEMWPHTRVAQTAEGASVHSASCHN